MKGAKNEIWIEADNEIMRGVANFMARQFMQNIEKNPDKTYFIEFRPDKDFRKPHPLNLPWDKCNSFVNISWNRNWLQGLTVTFGNFVIRVDEEGNNIYGKIAPQTELIVNNYQTLFDIKLGYYTFPKECLTIKEIKVIFDSIINIDGLISLTKTF